MENAHICWKDSRGAVCIRRGSCVLPWRCSQTVSRFLPVPSGACHAPLASTHLSVPSLTELSLLISARTGSMAVGGSSSQRYWGDSPTLFRSSRSTPADSEGEDL